MDVGLRVCFSGGHKNVPGGPPATGAEPTKAPAAVGGNPCHAGTKAMLPDDDWMWQAYYGRPTPRRHGTCLMATFGQRTP